MDKLVSENCIEFVKGFEGYEPYTRNDMVGVPTLGYGMTGQEIRGFNYVTESQSSNMLENLINKNYALPIKNNLDSKNVKLNQNEFDALVSMAYNIGTCGLLGSTLYKNVCNGNRNRNTITSNFRMWCKAGGRTVEGLLRRRTEEAQMFFGNNAVSVFNSAPTKFTGNNDIADLQKALNSWGSHLKVDGWIGDLTKNECPLLYNNCGREGNVVKWLQKKLGLSDNLQTGYFGDITEKEVRKFQCKHGVAVDGMVGYNTWCHLMD